jgi:hypothetical protein
MEQRCCRFCHQQFEPSRFHPKQETCSQSRCQQQRRSENRKHKLEADDEYRQVCRESARKWRANHLGYWRQYRALKPESLQRNLSQQQLRDQQRRLADLANNNSARNLKSSPARVWWWSPDAEPANNNLAPLQVLILQGSALSAILQTTT